MKRLNIHLKKRMNESYEIKIGDNFLKRLIIDLKNSELGKKYAIITDSNIKKLYGEKLQKDLTKAGFKTYLISFPNGEKNKNFQTIEKILDQLFKENFQRNDAIIALGGGVTGDIAGFVASIYMRGIQYLQIPTTLLAMIDSAIGGKTGINSEWGKNMIGTFYQPKRVYINTKFLETLPKKQIKNGIAEAIKYGIIADKQILKMLNKNKEKIFLPNSNILLKIILRCVKVKSYFVTNDEKENDIRKLLNYGHTIGHAIEKLSKFSVQHGEAISIGMSMINTIAVSKRIMKKKDAEFVKNLIKLYGLPIELPRKIDSVKLIKALKNDKKNIDEKLHFIVASKLGKAKISTAITNSDITKACKKHA